MLKKTITLLIAVHFIITACGHSSDNSSTGSSQLSTTAPAINSNGEIVTTVNSTSGAKIAASSLQSSSNDPLSQLTSVEIPAGALSNAADIKIFETPSLAQNVTAASFGLTTISKAGPSIAIQSSATLSQPITVSVPYSLDGAKLLLAGQNLAVLVLSGSTVDLMTGDQINIGLNTVDVKVSKFGAFQVINYTGSVMQTTATSQISDSSLQSTMVAAAAPATTPTPTPAAAPAATITPTPTPAVTLLDGDWVFMFNNQNCYEDREDTNGNPIYSKSVTKITNNIQQVTNTMYSSSDCSSASLLYTENITVNFSVGRTIGDAKAIDNTVQSYSITPASTTGVQVLKSADFWPSINWQVGAASSPIQQQYTEYTIFKIDGNTLFYGMPDDANGLDNSSDAKRTRTLWTNAKSVKL